ncbi:MAG: hypothetical protein IJ001_08240 [Oscillospiraceae bacterium]|nr:hypothetical protein [Oscillospiraceae bacterium]
MKKAGLLLGILVLLTGCSPKNRELERGMELRSKLLKAEGCSFTADITADYGDKLYSFSMECTGDAQGNLTFTVTAPETIAGITGNVSDTGGNLTFDDTALYFELLADGQLSPVSGPWILLKTLRSGYITSASTEEDLLRLAVDDSYEDDALHLDIWVDGEDRPIRAEILYDGRRILTLDVKDFQIL